MKKMEEESRLVVTFSKRQYSLFKKACELCTHCGAELAVIVFSPNGKVYSFGHPDVDTVIDRFLTRNPQIADPTTSGSNPTPVEINMKLRIGKLNKELTEYLDLVNQGKKKGKMLDLRRSRSQPKLWWENPIEELNLKQLEQLRTGFELLKVNVLKEAGEKTMKANSMDHDDNNNPMGIDPK